MSSLTNNQINVRSMNGLVSVTANSGTFDELDCNTLTVALSATAPTVSALSNDTNVATTAWVTSHAGGSYVTLAGMQTITGQKTFSNANTFITGALNAPTIKTTLGTSMTIATDPVGYTDDIDITTANDLTLTAGFNAVITCYQGSFSATNFQTFTSGGGMSFNYTGVTGLNFNGSDIFFNNTGSQTVFYAIPSCAISPTTGNHICNKTYVDSISSSPLAANNVWTGTNTFNSFLPTSTVTPTTGTDLTTKTYVDGAITSSSILASNNSFTGTNQFSTALSSIGTATFLGTVNVGNVPPTASTDFNFEQYCDVYMRGRFRISQANYATLQSDQLGYSVSGNGTPSLVFTSGTLRNLYSISIPAGAWVVSFAVKLSTNGGAGTFQSKFICLSSVSSASATEYRNYSFNMEMDDGVGGNSDPRDILSFSGTVNNSTATTYYVNAKMTFTGIGVLGYVFGFTYTRIG